MIRKRIIFLLVSLYFLVGTLSYSTGQVIITIRVDKNVASAGQGDTWGTAFRYLQDALDQINPSEYRHYRIWVAQGTYYPTENSNYIPPDPVLEVFEMLEYVSIYGGFEGDELSFDDRNPELYPTILSGDIGIPNSKSDNSKCIILSQDINEIISIDGFLITGLRNDYYSHYGYGQGYFVSNNSNLEIRNCIIDENSIETVGRIMRCESSNIELHNCTFRNIKISGEGVFFNSYNTPFTIIVDSCLFENNRVHADLGVLSVSGQISMLNISNTVFRNNITMSGDIYINGSIGSYVTISNSQIINHLCFDTGGGGIVCGNTSLLMQNCILANNIASRFEIAGYGGGISYSINDDSYSCEIVNCTFYDNIVSQGSIVGEGKAIAYSHPEGSIYDDNLTVVNSILWDDTNLGEEDEIWTSNGNAIDITYSDIYGVGQNPNSTNIDESPEFYDPGNYDFHIKKISPCRDAGYIFAQNLPPTDFEGDSRIIGISVDMGADERFNVIHVDVNNTLPPQSQTGSTWDLAFSDLQDALEIADYEDEIWVAKGTYYPSEIGSDAMTDGPEENVFEIHDGFKLYGGFFGDEEVLWERDWEANPTILSGYINGTNNCFRVIYSTDIDNYEAIIDGFVVEEADASSTVFGGGMSFYDCNAQINIFNCTFRNNAGGLYNAISTIKVENCNFINNQQFLYSDDGFGGIDNYSGDMIVNNCSFINNSSHNGGGIFNFCATTVYHLTTINNCVFSQNSAISDGGAISNTSWQTPPGLIVNNCSFSNNYCASGRTIYNSRGEITIRNSILWSDDGYLNAHIGTGSGPGTVITTVDYSDIQDGIIYTFTGIGNMVEDPKFYNPSIHDLHLRTYCPFGRYDPSLGDWSQDGDLSNCIDAGDPGIWPDPPNELDPHGGRINMGAFGNTWQASKTPPGSIYFEGKNMEVNADQDFGAVTLLISPNPFSYSCQVSLRVDEDSFLDLNIYNMKGQQVFNLYSGHITKGEHSFYWYGKNKEGQDLNNGIYMVVCSSSDEKDVEKVVLLR